jgi:hypothetical protein
MERFTGRVNALLAAASAVLIWLLAGSHQTVLRAATPLTGVQALALDRLDSSLALFAPSPAAADLKQAGRSVDTIESRVAQLEYAFNTLSIQLGQEKFVDYGKDDRRVPQGPYVVTGFSFGRLHGDLALYYREVKLNKAIGGSGSAPTGGLDERIHQLEMQFAGLEINVDRSDKWRDYKDHPFFDSPNKVPEDAPNVLTGLLHGTQHEDTALYYGTLTLTKKPKRQPSFSGTLSDRVAFLEGQLARLHPAVVGPEDILSWGTNPGAYGGRVTPGRVITGIGHPRSTLISMGIQLSWD